MLPHNDGFSLVTAAFIHHNVAFLEPRLFNLCILFCKGMFTET